MNYDQWKDPTDYSDDPSEPLPLNVECPRCGADIGRSCTSNTIRGTWAAKTHALRWKKVGVDNPSAEDRSRDYWDFKKRQQDRIVAAYDHRKAK